jgi:hypothetical protein
MELLNERFKNADPFPHIILDNWIDDNQLSLVHDEIRSITPYIWQSKRDPLSKDMEVQKRKLSIAECTAYPIQKK